MAFHPFIVNHISGFRIYEGEAAVHCFVRKHFGAFGDSAQE